MHTPSGCAYGCPCGAPIIGRDFFFLLSHVHSPSARFRLQWAPSGAHMHALRACIIMHHPLGGAYVHPVGVHIYYAHEPHPSGVCINGCPLGHPIIGLPIMGHPMGAPYVQPIGCTLFFLSFVARPLAFGSFPAPMHTRWVCIWVPRWVHPLQYVKRSPFVINPKG